MNQGDKNDGQTRVPAQQMQQPQPAAGPADSAQAPQMPPIPKKGAAPGPLFDDARFTAGVVKLYEALLKEPIPEEMLRLVDEIGKQEPSK